MGQSAAILVNSDIKRPTILPDSSRRVRWGTGVESRCQVGHPTHRHTDTLASTVHSELKNMTLQKVTLVDSLKSSIKSILFVNIVCLRGLHNLHRCDTLCPYTLKAGQANLKNPFRGKEINLKESQRWGIPLPGTDVQQIPHIKRTSTLTPAIYPCSL